MRKMLGIAHLSCDCLACRNLCLGGCAVGWWVGICRFLFEAFGNNPNLRGRVPGQGFALDRSEPWMVKRRGSNGPANEEPHCAGGMGS
jgi:hypothetical protein